ncbi:MAG: glycoside hydrolase family 130 protein [Minisyncoccota bacterium]
MFTLNRFEHNPLLSPNKQHPWETYAAFNGCPAHIGKKKFLIYRAMSEPDELREPHISTSVVASASSSDGILYSDRSVLVAPQESYDQYGCEDPRVTKLGDTHYIFYTALGGVPFSRDNIKVAVALSKDLKTVSERHLVTPFNAKAMVMFPEKINGKIAVLLSYHTDTPPSEICYAEFDSVDQIWDEKYWSKWNENIDAHKISMRRRENDHLELGSTPVKTKHGWLVVYSHVQNYNRDNTVFGVEIVLLDLKNPRKIVGRTKGPFMVPEEYYEKIGQVSKITFPTGAEIEKDNLVIYYGASDTHCCKAFIPLDNLLDSIMDRKKDPIVRYAGNPIITPRPGVTFEAGGTLNPGAIDIDGTVHILYRAVSDKNISTIGYATSKDGLSVDYRHNEPVYVPRVSFEMKDDGGYGCEDPRLIRVKDTLYMMYTAYNGSIPRIAITSISIKDFLAKHFNKWSMPEAISPEGIVDKDAIFIPELINGKYMIIHRIGDHICADFVPALSFEDMQLKQCINIISPRKGMWDGGKVGISTPAIKTNDGWLVLYHGVSSSTTYRVGCVLLDLKNPALVKARTAVPFFEPIEEYEHKGVVANVVFPCGIVERSGTVYIYYGAADDKVGVATIKLSKLLSMLTV